MRGDECRGDLEPWARRFLSLQNFIARIGLAPDKPPPASGLVTLKMQEKTDAALAPIFKVLFGRYTSQCDQAEIIIPSSFSKECGSDGTVVRVLVHSPKRQASAEDLGSKPRPGLIYAHGGGFLYFSADTYVPLLSRLAVELDMPVYSVDVRLAPQHPCPAAAFDVYTALKYLHAHAGELGLDPRRVGLGGESAGGHAILGSCVLLAQRAEVGARGSNPCRPDQMQLVNL